MNLTTKLAFLCKDVDVVTGRRRRKLNEKGKKWIHFYIIVDFITRIRPPISLTPKV